MIDENSRVVVWDWTVRLFHWSIVLLVVLSWWTAEQGMMDWHRRSGIVLLGLLVYRLVWGLIGPSTARFSVMWAGPIAALTYLRTLRSGTHQKAFGHNPAGALSIIAMLFSLSVQIFTGLFSVDTDGLQSGPLARFVSFETGRQFAEIHDASFKILLALIALHLSAILAYQFLLKERLVSTMVTGRSPRSDFDAGNLPRIRAGWKRIVATGLVAAVAVVAVLFVGG
jgi:cytochrome b